MDTKWYQNQQFILSIFEVLLNVAIGLFFYVILSMDTVAIIIWFVGSLLVLDRIILTHINQSNHEKLEGEIGRIGQVIDISNRNQDGLISDLSEAYYHITDEEFSKVKDKYINTTLLKLKKLRDEKSSDELTVSEGYDLFLPILEKVSKGNSIKAVSFILPGEWDDSPQSKEYLKGNIFAAQKGASVERIFIMDRNSLRKFIENNALKSHTKEQENITKLKGFFIDSVNLKNDDPELYHSMGDGFIIIDSKVALIDKMYSDGRYRNIITLNDKIIKSLNETFTKLKRNSIELSLSLID